MIIVHEVEQGSPEWHKLRLGLPTSSMFSSVLAKGEGKTRKSYMHKLAAELVTGELIESFKSPEMARGNAMESEARDMYSFMTDATPRRVGFITNGDKGCSPDSLIGNDGLLEIKTQRPDLLIETLFKGKFPSEHVAQCQGNLWVAEREWIDIVVYWPNFPLFKKRAIRDESYIRELDLEVKRFNEELAEVVHRIKQYG